MSSETWLTQAWEEIRRNKGSRTPGVDRQTAEDISPERIQALSERLRDKTYRPTPVRRVHIPKGNGKSRPLGIPTVEDRIVQQALRMVLEPIFEADFLPCSHGFRAGHSPHTALRDVARWYPNVTWIIEGDIVGCYDNIPHKKLMEGIQQRIADERILSLIDAFLKAGYMEEWQYHKTYSGTPQGGIASPLLCNIFLHQLDMMVINELEANQTQTKRESNARRNPEYRRIENAIQRARKKLAHYPTREERRQLVQTLKDLRKELKQTPWYASENWNKGKVYYTRYADDFAVLINGTKREAEDVQDKIKWQLAKMGLELSEEKTKLTHWSETVRFLGYNIQGKPMPKGHLRRAYLSIPKERERLIRREILKIARYHHIPELDAMMQIGAKFRGWCHYYRYANAPQSTFSRLAQKTWWYYAHFMARKHKTSIKKMTSQAKKSGRLKVIKKAGRTAHTFSIQHGKKEYVLDIIPPKTATIQQVTAKDWTVDLKPVNPLNWQSGRSLETRLMALARSGGLCERCGENRVVHVHHKSRMSTKKTLKAKVQSDTAQRPKTLALCLECHLESHRGNWQT
jgi:group II intron reverse transcriptase/maturase